MMLVLTKTKLLSHICVLKQHCTAGTSTPYTYVLQRFCKTLYLLVSQVRPNQRQHGSLSVSDPHWRWLGLTCETTVLILSLLYQCLYTCVNCSASFHVVWASGCLFGKLASLHAIWDACKSFTQLSNGLAWFLNGTTSLCIIESGATSLKIG